MRLKGDMIKVLFSLIALIIIPSVCAVTLDSASLTWNAEPIKYISPSNVIPSILTFEFTAVEDVNKIVVDLSQLNPSQEEYSSYVLDLSSCIRKDSTRKCSVSGVMIRSDNANPVIHFNFSNSTDWTSVDSSFSFTLDNTNPEVTFIGPKTCVDDKCYVGSGVRNKIFIEMQDEVASFSRGLVFFTLGGGSKKMVSLCDGMSCYGFASVNCIDGQSVQVSLSNHPFFGSSRDDANNKLVGAISNNLICDELSPVVDEDSITYSSGSGLPTSSIQEEFFSELPYVNIGDEVIISFNVTDPTTPSMNVSADISSIGQPEVSNACVKVSGYTNLNPKWSCSIRFTVTPTEPSELAIPITVHDLTGHTSSFDAVFDATEPQDDTAITYWTIASNPRPMNANKRFLEFSPEKLFMTVKLNGGPNNRILKVDPIGCDPAVDRNGDAEGSPGDIIDFEISKLGGTTLFAKAILTPGNKYATYGDSAGYNCSFNVWTKSGDHIATYPELKWFRIGINFHNSKTIGEIMTQGIQEEINKTLESAERTAGYRAILNGVNQMCDVPGILKGSGSLLSGTGGVLSSTGYTPLVETGETLGKSGEALSKAGEIEPLTTLCQFAHCEHNFNKLLTGSLDNVGWLNSASETLGFGSNISGTINPYDSIYTAYMTGCVPAILDHMERKQAISCELIKCLSEGVPMGTLPETCYKTAQYATCVYNWGNVYGLPLIGTVRGIFRDITNIFRDPVSLFSSGGVILACKGLSMVPIPGVSNAGKWFCEQIASTEGAIQAYNNAHHISVQFNDLMGTKKVAKSACDSVRENIDNSNTYWNYPENEGPMLNQRTTIRFGGKDYLVSCSQYTGCTAVGDNDISLAALPTSRNSVDFRWFIGGRAVSDDVNRWLNEPNSKKINLDNYDDYQGLVNGGFIGSKPEEGKKGNNQFVLSQNNKALSKIKKTTKNFRSDILRRIDETGNEDLINSFNNYFTVYEDYNNRIGSIQDAARESNDNYLLVDHFEDNLRDLVDTNSQLQDALKNEALQSDASQNDASQNDALKALKEALEKAGNNNFGKLNNLKSDQISKLPSDVRAAVLEVQGLVSQRDDLKKSIEQGKNLIKDGNVKSLIRSLDLNNLDSTAVDGFMKNNKDSIEKASDVLKEKAEKNQDKVKKLEDSVKDARTAMRRNLLYERNWADAKFIGSTVRWGRAVRSVGPTFSNLISKGSAEHYSHQVDSVLESMGSIGEVLSGNWEYYQCRDKLGAGDDGIVLSQTASTTFTPQAHVEALRIKNGWGSNKNYSYQINVYVRNGNDYTDFDVSIWLRGDGSKLVNKTHLDSEHPLFDRVRQHFILVEGLTHAYDEVCLRFSDDLYKIFDMTGANPGKEICRRIEVR